MAVAVQIPSLADFTSLERLELSYNQISSLQPLQQLRSARLSELYVANNAVQKIEVRCNICTTPFMHSIHPCLQRAYANFQ